jgi:hypothetical protein
MTPILAMEGLPATGGRLAGVDLAPDGVRFYQPATSTITPPGGAAVEALSFSSRKGVSCTSMHCHPIRPPSRSASPLQ